MAIETDMEKGSTFIRRRCMTINRCVNYEEDYEDAKQLFIHCRNTNQIWYTFLNLLEVKWCMPESPEDLLLRWSRRGLQKGDTKLSSYIVDCVEGEK